MEVREPIPAAYRLTVADWLEMPERDGYVELLQGELLVTPSPLIAHQRIVGNLHVILRQHLDREGRGEVFLAPTGVVFTEDTVLEPDLVVVLSEHAGQVKEQYLEAPPDLVVEVLSRGTAGRDLQAKRAVYEAAGVTEYWIADPLARSIEVLSLLRGSYESRGRFGTDAILSSAVLPQLAITVESVFSR